MAATGTTTYTAAELLDLANADASSSPLTTRTLRYYTSLKLIDPPVTRQGQAARYTERHLQQLEVVRQRRAAGRGLAEIAAEIASEPEPATQPRQVWVGGSAPTTPPASAAAVPAGLPLPDAATGVTAGGYPRIHPLLPAAPADAQVSTIAPGVQVVLTGPAIGDRALLRRLIDAANPTRFPIHSHRTEIHVTDTDARPATAAGTLAGASGEILPLTGVAIDADIRAGAITVETTATFVNDLAAPLEVTYLYPLPAGFAPVAATCTIAGRTIRADLVARADARRAYDDALADGQTAALAEQVGEDLFALAVGNIAPDEVATIHVTVVGTADVDDGQATLRIPLSVGERYQPPGTASHQPTRRTHVGWREPTATVTVHAHGVEPTVVTHDATYAADGDDTTATVRDVALLHDVVVRWPAHAGWTAELTAGDGGQGWLTVTATMAAPVERAGRDVVVLLDRSGSMGGWQMDGARRVARAIVDRLGPADRVCVLAFDTELETAPGGAGFAPADAAHRRRLHEWIDTVDSRGGTELTRAFVTASGLVADSHGRATIVIVTDAEIGDEQRCIAAIGMSDADVITVGVGGRVNRGLIAAIGERSGGWSTIVESPERLAEAVGDIANRCAGESRRIDTVAVNGAQQPEWSGPHPQLYAGHQTVLRAALSGAPTTVTVTGPGFRETVPVTAGGAPQAGHLWARARVATMLREPDVAEEAALKVALAGGVLCRLTAFVALDPSGRRLGAVPVQREVGHLDMHHAFAAAPAPMMARQLSGGSGRQALAGAGRPKLAAVRSRFSPAAATDMDAAARPMQSPMAPPPAVSATTVAELCAEIAAIAADLTGQQRVQAIGAWAERVASLLGGPDDAAAKALAAKLAAALVGGDPAWQALLAWATGEQGAA